MHPMVLLGDKAQVDAHFIPFGDSANLDARYVHDLRWMFHRLINHFGRTRWYSYMTWVMWNLILVHLEIVLVSMQGRCMVYAKHTEALETFWTDPMMLLGDEAQVEARFSPFGDRANLDAR
jgi:hypothetical protein